jgi:hypothetical protein
MSHKYLANITNPQSIITPIDASIRFPEILTVCQSKYASDIENFKRLIASSATSADLLIAIRSTKFTASERMSLLKMFRRAVSPVMDTEMAKKMKVPSGTLIEALGHTFKPIELLKSQFASLTADQESSLAALIGEYDTRGQLGYILTGQFFDWFEAQFKNLFTIEGPRGAGRDVELSSIFGDFKGSYPCDFVIRCAKDSSKVLAVGFARYDSTRGGAQSDDRTGGNADKVGKAKEYFQKSGIKFRILFLSDGPGMAHKDTWAEACLLDGTWDGNVRVTTLKTAGERITPEWLTS